MRTIDENIHKTEKKLQYYSKEVASLLRKREYGNFLNIYLKLLYENLIKYQALTQVKLECKNLYDVKEKNIEKNQEDEKE